VRSTPGLMTPFPIPLPIQEGITFLVLAGFGFAGAEGAGVRADFLVAATVLGMAVKVAGCTSADKPASGKRAAQTSRQGRPLAHGRDAREAKKSA